MPIINMDHAAATPLDAGVMSAMKPYFTDKFANPSSLYSAARETCLAVDSARARIAYLLGAKQTEIIFTSGGTESNNMAVLGAARKYPGGAVVMSAIEHDSVLACAEPLRAEGHNVTIVPVRSNGVIDSVALAAAIGERTVLVSVMMANNEIGTIQPLGDVAKLIYAERTRRIKAGNMLPIYLHTDACQAAGYLDLQVSRLAVDLLTLNGAKVYGPKGTGLLYVRQGTELEPLVYGGGQERGRRSGTENVAGVVGLSLALELAWQHREEESRRLSGLRDNAIRQLLETIPRSTLNGDTKRRLPGNISLTLAGAEGEALVLYLDKAGIMASTGSACSTGELDPSHVLVAIGRTPVEANSSLRLTLGRSTTVAHIATLVEVLPPIVERLRELG